MAVKRQAQQMSQHHSGYRPDRLGAPDHEDTSAGTVLIRSPVCSLDRADAKGPLDRRQAAAGLHHAGWRRGITSGVGNRSDIRHSACTASGKVSAWLAELLRRKSPKLAAVALANKMARMAWKLMVSGETYNAKSVSALMADAA